MFVDKEHEYEVAGWLGTISIMAAIAIGPQPRRILKGHDAYIFDLCKDIAEKENLCQKIGRWVADKANNEDRIHAFTQANITDGNGFKGDFEFAYDIFSDDEWFDLVVKESNFGRLYPTIEGLVEYYTPTNVPIGLAYTVVEKQRDIAFYAGHYDPGF